MCWASRLRHSRRRADLRRRMHPRSRSHLWRHRHTSIARHGHKGQAYCSRFALAERFRRTVDRLNPPRVCGPHYCLGRGAPAPDPAMPCALLQRNQNPSGAEQGCVALSRRSASWNHQITRNRRWTSSPIHPDLIFATHTYRLERRRNVCGLKKFHRGSAMIATPTGVNIAIRMAAVFIAAPPAPRSASRASAQAATSSKMRFARRRPR